MSRAQTQQEDHFQESTLAVVACVEAFQAGLVGQSTGQVAFTGSSGSGQDHIQVTTDPVTVGQL